jgi:hypothetical protein
MKLYAEGFHLNLSRQFMFDSNWIKVLGTLHKDLSILKTTYPNIPAWYALGMLYFYALS